MKILKILLSMLMVAAFSTAAMAATVTIHNGGADVIATLSGSGISVDTNGDVVLWVSESLSLSGGGGGTSDTTAPGAPSNVTATAASSSQINLAWSASTDNVGVAGYKIYRGGSQIATTSSTTYSNTGLSASTQYCYTVAAYDAAGNTSGQSSQSCATTQAASTGTSGSCIDLGPQYPKVYGCTSSTTSSCSAQVIPAGGAVNYCFTIDIATAASIVATMSSMDWITSSHEFLSNIANPTSSVIKTILASGSVGNSTGNPPWYSLGSGSNERIVVRGQSAKKGDKYYVTVYNPGSTSSKIILYWNAYSY